MNKNYLKKLTTLKEVSLFEKNLINFFFKIENVVNFINEIDEIYLISQSSKNFSKNKKVLLFFLSNHITIAGEVIDIKFNGTLNNYQLKERFNIKFSPNKLNLHNVMDLFNFFKEFELKYKILESSIVLSEDEKNDPTDINQSIIALNERNVSKILHQLLNNTCPYLPQRLEKEVLEKKLNSNVVSKKVSKV